MRRMKLYCVKCRDFFVAKDYEVIKVKGHGRTVKMIRAKCPDCGNYAYRIIG